MYSSWMEFESKGLKRLLVGNGMIYTIQWYICIG